jgi:geranylgeranyl pyrophosphate synthase/predicted secreted hydrolase
MGSQVQAGKGWRGDWPPRGASVHLERDDLPHPGCGAEWWHFHCHLTTPRGDEHGVVVMFARDQLTKADGSQLAGHWLLWSRSDCGRRSHTSGVWLDRDAVDAMRQVIADDLVMDPRVRTALLEALVDGLPISPDRSLPGVARLSTDRLDLEYGEAGTLRKLDDGSYQITVRAEHEQYDLTLTPGKAPTWQTRDGRLHGRYADDSDATYSYVVPRCEVQGLVTVVGDEPEAVSGTGRFEHAFGGVRFRLGEGQRDPDRGWRWTGMHLDNGWDVAAWSLSLIDITTEASTTQQTLAVGSSPSGERVSSTVELIGSKPWTSLSTLNTYPTRWVVRAPELDLLVTVEAGFPEQEIPSMIFGPGFLEASAMVSGTMAGQPVSGHAFIEVMQSQRVGDFEGFLGRLRDTTHHEVDALFPDQPAESVTSSLLGGGGSSLEGISDGQVHDALVRPVRYVVEGAGKGWRTYVTCAAIELFGVRSTPYAPLLAVTELIHSSNLMIDDVEDESTTRRGKPCAHLVFGTAQVINSGTAAYFVFDRVLDAILPDDPVLRLQVYKLYVRTLRTAHGGQAIDLAGHTRAMDAAVASGDAGELLRRIRATHRFKTGVPARGFAEVGAVIAGASADQVAAMGDYFEAVGTAYQMTDDLLDVHGLIGLTTDDPESWPKHSGEDLRAGKVTMPLAHAVARLPGPQMSELWRSVRGGADLDTAREAAASLFECGAVAACYAEAKALVDETWEKLDGLLPGSQPKVMVRALGFYAAMREPDLPTPGYPPLPPGMTTGGGRGEPVGAHSSRVVEPPPERRSG